MAIRPVQLEFWTRSRLLQGQAVTVVRHVIDGVFHPVHRSCYCPITDSCGLEAGNVYREVFGMESRPNARMADLEELWR